MNHQIIYKMDHQLNQQMVNSWLPPVQNLTKVLIMNDKEKEVLSQIEDQMAERIIRWQRTRCPDKQPINIRYNLKPYSPETYAYPFNNHQCINFIRHNHNF